MSILDVFANGMGCVLMLMVVFVLRLTVTSTGGSGQKARPMMVTVAWSEAPPPTGAGPTMLRMRVRRADGYADETSDDFPNGWRIVEPLGASYGDSSGDVMRRRSLVALVPELPRNTRWELQLKLTLGQSPIRQTLDKTHPYERLVSRIEGLWEALEGETSDSARSEILGAARDYLTFLELVSEFQAKWLEQEQQWEASPAGVDRFLVTQHRWSMAADFYAKARSLSYPSLSSGGASAWYDSFVDKVNNVESLRTSEFERELTRQIRSELEIAGGSDGKGVQLSKSPAGIWIAGIEDVLSEGFSLPVSVTFVGGVGAEPIIDQPCSFVAPFVQSENEGWSSLSTLAVDARARVSWNWGEVQPTNPTLTPQGNAADREIRYSKWDSTVTEFDRTLGDRTVIESVDSALRHLSSLQKDDGRFPALNNSYDGPAITGLCLLAFLARGHAPDVTASEYRDTTVRAIEYLTRLCERNNNEGRLDDGGSKFAYHHGFATIALAQSLPRLEKSNPDLHARAKTGLRNAVDLLVGQSNLGQGPTGGWGYNAAKDDTSVAAVQVKALRDASFAIPSLQTNADLISAFAKARQFFESARQTQFGSYNYTNASKGVAKKDASQPLAIADLPARLPGSLLAECYCDPRYFGSERARKTWAKGMQRFVQWTPALGEVTSGSSHTHYAIFYAAQLRRELHCPDTTKWFRNLTRVLVQAQRKDGSFAQDTYGTAMAIIALLLPLNRDLENTLP